MNFLTACLTEQPVLEPPTSRKSAGNAPIERKFVSKSRELREVIKRARFDSVNHLFAKKISSSA